MRPKDMKCPVCGKNLFLINWGMKREMSLEDIYGRQVPLDTMNKFEAKCSCGFSCSYYGKQDIWHKCKCKHQKCDGGQVVNDPNLIVPRKGEKVIPLKKYINIELLEDYRWFTTSWESFNEIEKNAGHNGIRKEDSEYKYLLITYDGAIEVYRYKE